MVDQKNIDAFERIYIAGLKIAMEVGGMKRVRVILDDWTAFVTDANISDWIDVFRDAEEWYGRAIQHETIHGKGSVFNPDHPFIQDVRAYRRQMRGLIDSSGSSTANEAASARRESKVSDQFPEINAA